MLTYHELGATRSNINGPGKRKLTEVSPCKVPCPSTPLNADAPREINDEDTSQQMQELHVTKRQKWMKEFMAGKEAHPFFLQVRAKSSPTITQARSSSPQVLKPIEACLPGPMFYASGETMNIALVRSPATLFKPSPLRFSSQPLACHQSIQDQGILTCEEFYFPSSPNAWAELFKLSSTNKELDPRCYRDFLQDSSLSPSTSSGDWLKLYSATSSKHFLGNQASLADVRVWLENWKVIACSQEADSDDETILDLPISDDDSDYGSSSSKRAKAKRASKGSKNIGRRKRSKPRLPPITILSGPSGVGKTAAVHACAHDCGYKVLEINSASVRTGSELTNLVGQLSRSHLVNSVKSINSFFSVKKQAASGSSSPKPNLLILIDEADLLFQGERSFLTALTQLAASTRRPFILTTNGNTVISLI